MQLTSRGRLRIAALLTLSFLFLLSCGGDKGSHAGEAQAAENTEAQTGIGANCSFGPAVRDANGVAHLALLVGVGAYQDDSIQKLSGPPEDVKMMRALLSGPGGFGFPEQNVCRLVDKDATEENFRTAIDRALLKRAKKDDVVVVYFSGHGTQLPDTNHDESDLSDEVLLLVDSRTSRTAIGLRDDEFATLLKPLRAVSGNVVVILDSCNSGSATRAASTSLVRRFQEPRPEDLVIVERTDVPVELESSVYFTSAGPGLITISAAIDGTSALEKASSGVFTKALVASLSQVTAQPLTYRQLARKVPPFMAADSTQIASFEGDLDRVVFGATDRKQPLALEVLEVGPPVKLGGTIIPGLGRNAELRVFSSDLSGADLNDPSKSKAMLIVDTATGLNAEARVLNKRSGAEAIAPGDLAVLVRPSDDAIALQVRIRPAAEPGGVPVERAAKIKAAIAENLEAASLVKPAEQLADFEISVDALGRYNILGPEGQIRNVLEREASVAEDLWLHARQRAFLNLRSESGTDLIEDSSLTVTVAPGPNQRPCVRTGATLTRDEKGAVIVPLCYTWQARVKLDASAKSPLRLGGLVLSSDGSVYGFPANGKIETISPGGPEVTFEPTFVGSLPLGINDYLIVFGTRMENWVDWAALSATASARDAKPRGPTDPPKGPLHRALDRYVRAAGTRGVEVEDLPYEDTAWTRTTVALRTEANPAFETGLAALNPGSKEYTIKEFDIRPYLPDDKNTALYRVLTKADWLAKHDFPYKQHGWKEGGDDADLAKGIDCSRATWFAFTRAGLEYNAGNNYLATADMVKSSSRMSDQFVSCPLGGTYETGDLLVYRDDQQGDGHVVMVIDPAKRIAWGSHGWDGNAKEMAVPPDTGVEYQLIKYKKDWARWDRKNLSMKACWRYKEFSAARARGLGQPGLAALTTKPCRPEVCNLVSSGGQ